MLRHMLTVVIACLLACALSAPAFADEDHSQVASTRQMGDTKPLLLEGMEPIAADQVNDGVYTIEAKSSSSFFRIYSCTLTVQDGQMSAAIEIQSSSYPLVYMGTGEQAAQASAQDYIAYDRDTMTFTVPVSALDAEIPCAAFSKKRSMWYDRMLMFYASSLPASALRVELPEYGDVVESPADESAGGASATEPQAVPLDIPDGEYSIEVNMTGGSGRASVSSPTWLTVREGKAYARLLWSSPYYTYMTIGNTSFDNQTDDGSNSTFTIPITAMNQPVDVIACTTAMGDPVEVAYQLTFYSDTIGDKDLIPQEAAVKVLAIALAIIVLGGILNHILKRKRKR